MHHNPKNNDNPETKVESKEKELVASSDTSTSGKNDPETKENTET